MAIDILLPNARLLSGAVILDLLLGDPVYPFHPVRLIGRSLTFLEKLLRRAGMDGYGGGILLLIVLSFEWAALPAIGLVVLKQSFPLAAQAVHLLLVYSLIAMQDLLRHAGAVESAASRDDLEGARTAIARLVGRDTSKMDISACRRAAIESISENLTDGFISPIFWYALAGIPGLFLFKIVSTMDSMVGYRTPRYLRFGWCGARTDDLMNLIPARISWVLISIVALVVPRCSFRKALKVGWRQHAMVPGPNSGWSEATIAGAIQRRLIGPIWAGGQLVTEVWLGLPEDPDAGTRPDLQRARALVLLSGVAFAVTAAFAISH